MVCHTMVILTTYYLVHLVHHLVIVRTYVYWNLLEPQQIHFENNPDAASSVPYGTVLYRSTSINFFTTPNIIF